jgi:hypothetical protein
MFWNKKYGTAGYLLVLENRLEKAFIYPDFYGQAANLCCLASLLYMTVLSIL